MNKLCYLTTGNHIVTNPMKFPSLQSLLQGAGKVLKRFPLEMLFALTGTIASTVNIELNAINYSAQSWCWRITAGANLGLLLALSATLYGESRLWPKRKIWLLRLAAMVVTLGIVAGISPFERRTDAIRFFLLSFSFHLLVAFAAFIKKGMVHEFWQFNKTLFLRFLTSALYSAVLFLGLAAAIGAVNFLFNFEFEWDTFAIVWVWIVGIFSVIFFLAGVPDPASSNQEDSSYPKALKVFTQYVLIPLATVYVFILLAYEVKIIAEWQLPKGLVSRLVLGYAVFGILSILLVYPIRNQEDNKWIKTYAKSFYLLLLPLISLLFVATGARVLKYGVTEFRYFLIVLAFWLLFISLYFLFSRKQNIKVIPISLALLTLIAVYGPLSAFSISKSSQLTILKSIFKKNDAFKDGQFTPLNQKISSKDGNRAVATLRYLVDHHDVTALQAYFKQDLNKITDSVRSLKNKESNEKLSRYEIQYAKLEWVKKQLNLQNFEGYRWDADGENAGTYYSMQTYVNVQKAKVTEVRGYNYMINLNLYASQDSTDTTSYQLSNGTLEHVSQINDKHTFRIDGESLTFDVKAWGLKIANQINKNSLEAYKDNTSTNEYAQRYSLPPSMMSITKKTSKHTLTLKISAFNLYQDKKGAAYDISSTMGLLLIK